MIVVNRHHLQNPKCNNTSKRPVIRDIKGHISSLHFPSHILEFPFKVSILFKYVILQETLMTSDFRFGHKSFERYRAKETNFDINVGITLSKKMNNKGTYKVGFYTHTEIYCCCSFFVRFIWLNGILFYAKICKLTVQLSGRLVKRSFSLGTFNAGSGNMP